MNVKCLACNWFSAQLLMLMIASNFSLVCSSLGDNSPQYRSCLKNALKTRCRSKKNLNEFLTNQPLTERFLRWSCEDDCKYNCMWETVNAFKSKGLKVPQFHGKWPFIRLFGIQEPASMIFSVMNGVTHSIGLRFYLAKSSPHSPLYYPSICFAVMSINAWFWSTVFHTRDYPFTEKMDYFSATAGVLYSIYFCMHRMSLGLVKQSVKSRRTMRKLTAVLLLCLFFRHVTYLVAFFDYGYNMLFNVTVGLFNGALWLAYHCLTRGVYTHQWMSTCAIVFTTMLLSLEVMDFVPIFWIFDAHSLWHLGTVFFPFLWYPFMVIESNIVEIKIA